MATTYMLSTFLRQTPKPLLERYFSERGLLGGVVFGDLKRREVDAIVAELDKLADADRTAVDSDFQDIHVVADKLGTRIILELATLYEDPSVVTALSEMENHYERAMWLFLERRRWDDDLYDQCRDLVHVESIRFARSKRRNHLPQQDPINDEPAIGLMEQKLKELYRSQGRGRHCQVACFERPEPKRFYFVGYPEDYATTDLHYEGDELRRRPRRSVFDVAFLFRPDEGSLEIHAPGSKDEIDALHLIFCDTALGGFTPPPDGNARSFDLKKLLDRNFAFAVDAVDGIERVEVASMKLVKGAAKKPRITFETVPCSLAEFHRQLEAELKTPLAQWTVMQAKLRATFRAEGNKKPRVVSFTLAMPDASDLKDSREDLVLKRYLRRWGLAP